jgi:hypothetical protein
MVWVYMNRTNLLDVHDPGTAVARMSRSRATVLVSDTFEKVERDCVIQTFTGGCLTDTHLYNSIKMS